MQSASWSNDSLSNPILTTATTTTISQSAQQQQQPQQSQQSSGSRQKSELLPPQPYSSKVFDPLKPRKHHTRQRSQNRRDGSRDVGSSRDRDTSRHREASANTITSTSTTSAMPINNRPSNNSRNSSNSVSSMINPNPQSHPYFTSHTSPTPSIISSSHTASSAGIEADRDSHFEISSSSELDNYVNRNRKRVGSRRGDVQIKKRSSYALPSSGGGTTTNGTGPHGRDLSDDQTSQSEDDEDDWLNQTTSEEGGAATGGGSRRFDWDRRRGNASRGSSIRNHVSSSQAEGSSIGSDSHFKNSQAKRSTFDIANFAAGGVFSLVRRRGSAPDIKATSKNQLREDQFDDDGIYSPHQSKRASWLDTGILPSASEDDAMLDSNKTTNPTKGTRRFSSREADRPTRASIKRSSFNFGLSDATRARLRAVLPSGLLSSDLLNPNPNPNEFREARRGSAGTLVADPSEGQDARIRGGGPPSLVNREGSLDRNRVKKSTSASASGKDGTGTGSSSGETGNKARRRSSRLSNPDGIEMRKEVRPSLTEEVVEESETEVKDEKSMAIQKETTSFSSSSSPIIQINDLDQSTSHQNNNLRIPTTASPKRSPKEGDSQPPTSSSLPSSSRHSPSTTSQPLPPTSKFTSSRRPPPRVARKRTRIRASLHSHLQTSTFRITLSAFLEALILLLPTYYAIHRLLTKEMENVGGRDTEVGNMMFSAALELGWVAISSTIYWLIKKRDGQGSNSNGVPLHSSGDINSGSGIHSSKSRERDRMEPNAIWATDEKNYRTCQDDGVLYGLLLGPLLACASFFACLPPKGRLSPSLLIPTSTPLFHQIQHQNKPFSILNSSNSLPLNFMLPEQDPILLHSRSLPFPPLPLARASLITVQSLTSTALLLHLLATKWIRRPSEIQKSNWIRMRSFFGFSLVLVMGMEIIREGSSWLGIGFWTGLARWELFTASLVYQLNLYTISRLARRSFTIGELAIVSTLGVTLLMESIQLTIAKLWPYTTSYVKTFRQPTPLLYFQLALVVGTFIVGFLLSPLLYLSRNLAQKPLHRLRWPAKRDLHRRLLAGFFYFFAAAFVIGVLGMWVRWLLGNEDPWFWVAAFVIEGKYQWSRPLLMAYWLALVSASIVGWQTVVVTNKRIRLRAGNSRNMNLNGIHSKSLHHNHHNLHHHPSSSVNRSSMHNSNLDSISAVPVNSEMEGGPSAQAGMEVVDPKKSSTKSTTTSVSLGLGNLSNFSSNLNPFSNGFANNVHQSNHKDPHLSLGSLPPAPNPTLNKSSSIPPTPLSPPVQSTPVGLSFTTASNSIESLGNNSTTSSHLKKAAHLSLNARRKFFHALAVLMFVPGIIFDPAFTHLAFSLCFSLFIFGEYVRYYALYPFGATLHVFLSEFLDSKDSGPVILSHFYLLTGCAGPLWLEGDSVITQLTGVLVLGVGDALASIVGRRYGKKKWWTGNKTVEGTFAFWSSIMVCAWSLRILGLVEQFNLLKYSLLIAILALLEGVSAQNDNLVLPAFGSILSALLEI